MDVKAMEEPEDVTAPPIDSDEEKTDEADFGDPDPRYDSSDDEPVRGDIGRSDFKPNSASQKPSIAPRGGTTLDARDNDGPKRHSARPDRKRAKEIAEDPDADENGVSSAKKRAKTSDSSVPSSLGSHMGDGFLVDGKVKRAKPGYGRKAAKAAKTSISRESTPNRKFERVKSMSESVSPQVTRTFNILSPGSEASSPFRKPRALKASAASKKGRPPSLSDTDSDDVLSDPPRPDTGLGKPQKSKQNPKQQRKKDTRRFPEKAAKHKPQELSADEEVSQQPEFRMPEGYNDFASAIDRAGIDMPLYEDTATDDRNANLGPDQAPCPMCDEPVDKELLEEFSKGQRMSIARQAKFCHQHKRRAAEELWETKGYPKIDWKGLEARIAEHHSHLESVINGASSHFGKQLGDKIKAGKNRTLFTTDEYPVPGYYGLRGMSIMTESIIDAFSSLLRARAPIDKLISARGYTGFVQSVLVPELGARLIKEDMGLATDGEARAVMHESRDVGVKLNDEKGERPRVVAQAYTQEQAGSGSEKNGDDASGISHNGVGTDSASDDDDEVDLRIQRVDDSDADESSLPSLGGHGPKANRKARHGGGDSDPRRLLSLGQKEEPIAPGRDVVDDSDSDLSSLVSLDKL
ncbi:hypothetical protein KVR01_005644 [Diaporthe batatas]|uniref:uncharacterized protein n=1 Tax=Diaporthe batatas TaxID=748121 RepID=UPI001D04D0C4|nr:uncharacterized protein KVR01_005644 [Diaporthe batatas]KAG8165369.1 hypothetical protein KVR01_005644 [Diaporthe batatas]